MNFKQIIEQSRASIEKADLRVLLPILAEINPQCILEIGMHQGYSMEVWKNAFNPEILIGLELNKPTNDSVTNLPNMLWNHDSHASETLAITILRMGKFKEFDFLFIDGDHSYEGVRKDYEMYSRLVRRGGIIAFHDALYHADKTEEVDLYWDFRFRKKHRYLEIKASEHSTGIGLIWI